jgi:flagellar L-ring protein precursor FlgH
MAARIRTLRFLLPIAAVACLGARAAAAQPPKAGSKAEQDLKNSKNYEEIYARYLGAARQAPAPSAPLWMADLASDPRARRVNDLVTVRVLESVSATGNADSNIAKQSDMNISMPGKPGEFFSKFLPASSDTKFNGSGGTTRSTELTAVMTSRVTEVLPNGDLVVEGVREIDINGDRTLIVLTGVIRAIDILPGNVIPSSRIGQLRIRSLSQGLIKDSLTPGWLIRILNKIF